MDELEALVAKLMAEGYSESEASAVASFKLFGNDVLGERFDDADDD